ncbi:MAG TPA: TonB-dependent receptor plug domain-containing protein [Rhizomicrobium sp.]|nr:TonB-dependent receptor plug domain-containing protein [Rhizomicrobium sp.]
MTRQKLFKAILSGGACAAALTTAAFAHSFDIPATDLKAALNAYSTQSGVPLIFSGDAIKGIRANAVKGDMPADDALEHLLKGTGFGIRHDASGAVGIIRDTSSLDMVEPMQLAQAAPRPSVETVTVTSSKLGGGDVQSVPIAITAMSQEQLTATQTAGGPDLVKQVPNLTFSKTNFTGYNIQIRGIGTQAISVTTDPAVAVSFNDVPFLRNHFFEQEFFDVSQVEVLRGPQGTLYGRNATSGVVNVISARATDHWEAQASVDVGNYNNRRLEGMINAPILDDKIDLRVAGEWTKRDGYSFNQETDHSTDGRDLWSSRVSLLVHPISDLTATAVWEHFDESDDRLRSGKQLCSRDEPPTSVDGPAGPQTPDYDPYGNFGGVWLQQGCKAASLYAPESFGTPNAASIPFIAALQLLSPYMTPGTNPYAGVTQSTDLRVINSLIDPIYRAKNDTYELNVDFQVTPTLKLTSQTAYNTDSLYSTEDFNRYNTSGGIFLDPGGNTLIGQDGEYCDPQLGCSSRLVSQDISDETAHQFYQEVRLASSFTGNLNFVVGGNYLKYRTLENYQIMANAITLAAENFNGFFGGSLPADAPHIPFDPVLANSCNPQPAITDHTQLGQNTFLGLGCAYIDPNPLGSIDGQGHNYFRSQNPYNLSSWAGFGEVYYNVTSDVKLTGGLRFTDDQKHFDVIPSWALIAYKGYPITNIIDQEWREVTGRANITWTPQLDFTDQSLFYASYAHGYKGGGANPPGVIPISTGFGNDYYLTSPSNQTHPSTFEPEFNNAFELGTKNTLLDGDMVLNGDVFLYKYKNYQISQIIDRTAVNMNLNATVKGAELETTWTPLPGLKLGLTGGYEDARIDDGQSAIDIMDRTAGHTDWMVVKPFVTQTSNCIVPRDVINEQLAGHGDSLAYTCVDAYTFDEDPVTLSPYRADPGTDLFGNPLPGYHGFDPDAAPNHGEGFSKDLSGNMLPSAPHFTLSLNGDYTMPLSDDWAGTLHGDFYWQSDSFARVFNDRPYDEIRGYTNINMALIFTNQEGWQAMVYVKNLRDTTAITGAFLNSDDTALATNIFVTDPRLFGIRITKNW